MKFFDEEKENAGKEPEKNVKMDLDARMPEVKAAGPLPQVGIVKYEEFLNAFKEIVEGKEFTKEVNGITAQSRFIVNNLGINLENVDDQKKLAALMEKMSLDKLTAAMLLMPEVAVMSILIIGVYMGMRLGLSEVGGN